MLDENEVLDIFSAWLRQKGYEVIRQCHTTQQGIDLIARKDGSESRLLVEAKGGTSSREGSNRFGRPYTQSQVFDRVSKGFYSTLHLRIKNEADEVAFVGPDTPRFRKYLEPVVPIAEQLNIKIFLVSEDKNVNQL